MKKLSLTLDTLQVESFELPTDKQPRGTVKAYSDFCTWSCSCGRPFCIPVATSPDRCG
jgi:hypothetical protein